MSERVIVRASLLKTQITIFEVLDVLGVGVREPVTQQIKCPVHADRTPSARVYADKNEVFCFTCGRSWDIVGLAEAKLGLSAGDAVQWLEETFGISTAHATSPQVLRARMRTRPVLDVGPAFELFNQQLVAMRPKLSYDRFTRAVVALDSVLYQHRTAPVAFVEAAQAVLSFARAGIVP